MDAGTGLGLTVWIGTERVPYIFIADGQVLVLDLSKMKGIVVRDYYWSVGIERLTDQINYAYSGAPNLTDVKPVRCDLRSFVRNAADSVEVQPDTDGDWLLVGTLPEGKGTWRAEFRDRPGYPMHRCSTDFGGRRFTLSEIALNDDVDVTWPTMPAAAELPDPIRVRRLIWPRYGSMDRFAGQWWRIFKALYTVKALDDPAYRSRWVFGFADWDRIQQRNAELAPALRKLLVPGEP